MKLRIFALVMVSVLLAGCTNPFAKKDDFQTVVKTHFEALGESVGGDSLGNFSGTSHFDGNIAAKSKNQSIAIALNGDAKQHAGDSSVSLGLDAKLEMGSEKPVSAKGAFEGVFTTGTGYVKLGSLELTSAEKDPMVESMIKSMMGQYGGKWISISNTQEGTPTKVDPKAIKAAFTAHPIFAMTKDLGYKDGRYNYEVGLDKTQMLELEKAINQALTGTGLTDKSIEASKKEIENTSLVGVFSVENAHREYGSFSGTFSSTMGSGATATTETGKLTYENSKDAFKFEVSTADGGIIVAVEKQLTKAIGTITIVAKDNKQTPIHFTIEKTLDGYKLNVGSDFDSPTGERVTLTIDGNLSSKKDDKITIDIPKESIDLKSLLGGMMGSSMTATPENSAAAESMIGSMDSALSQADASAGDEMSMPR